MGKGGRMERTIWFVAGIVLGAIAMFVASVVIVMREEARMASGG